MTTLSSQRHPPGTSVSLTVAIDRLLVIDRIEKLALARGLSEGELLSRAGMKSGARTWSRWKNENVEPRLSNLAAIADTFDIPLPALTGETGETTIDRLEQKVNLILAHLGLEYGPAEEFARAFERLEEPARPANGAARSTPARKRRASSS